MTKAHNIVSIMTHIISFNLDISHRGGVERRLYVVRNNEQRHVDELDVFDICRGPRKLFLKSLSYLIGKRCPHFFCRVLTYKLCN